MTHVVGSAYRMAQLVIGAGNDLDAEQAGAEFALVVALVSLVAIAAIVLVGPYLT